MEKWNLIIDVATCENCHNCSLATKDEYIGNEFPGYSAPQPLHGHSWIKIKRKVRGAVPLVDVAYMPTMCNHCDNAPCISASGDGSIYKRSDGIVMIDPVKSKGRKDLVGACPYGAIWWNDEYSVPQKWSFDAHLLDQGWKEPRCSQACATGSMQAVKVDDVQMQRMAKEQGLEVLKEELNTRPRVYYKNLHRYMKCFIGGSVLVRIDGVIECASDVKVDLSQNGQVIATAQTDAFGDFKIDGLNPDSGQYHLSLSHPKYGVATRRATLGESTYLGEITLSLAAVHG